MAKTTSQIIAENRERNQQIQQVIDSRNAIHQQQMAEVAEKSAATTKAVLENAGYTDVAKTVEKQYAPVKEKVDPKNAREEQIALKKAPLTTKQKADNAKKAHEDYTKSDEYKQRTAERQAKYQKDTMIANLLTGIADVQQPKLIEDEKE